MCSRGDRDLSGKPSLALLRQILSRHLTLPRWPSRARARLRCVFGEGLTSGLCARVRGRPDPRLRHHPVRGSCGRRTGTRCAPRTPTEGEKRRLTVKVDLPLCRGGHRERRVGRVHARAARRSVLLGHVGEGARQVGVWDDVQPPDDGPYDASPTRPRAHRARTGRRFPAQGTCGRAQCTHGMHRERSLRVRAPDGPSIVTSPFWRRSHPI